MSARQTLLRVKCPLNESTVLFKCNAPCAADLDMIAELESGLRLDSPVAAAHPMAGMLRLTMVPGKVRKSSSTRTKTHKFVWSVLDGPHDRSSHMSGGKGDCDCWATRCPFVLTEDRKRNCWVLTCEGVDVTNAYIQIGLTGEAIFTVVRPDPVALPPRSKAIHTFSQDEVVNTPRGWVHTLRGKWMPTPAYADVCHQLGRPYTTGVRRFEPGHELPSIHSP